MRIPSGTTDQYIYFVAVDATDLSTRETGLSGFTIYRSRDGGLATSWTTPTVNETSSTNMPGVYELLLDEDTTVAAGNDSEEMCIHITHASMAPVTRVIELYRNVVTSGETLTVSSGGATVGSIAANAVSASALATDAVTEITEATWAYASRTLSSLDEDATTLDLDATIRAAVGLGAANLGTLLSDIDTVVDSILVDTVEIGAAGAGLTAVPWNAAWDAQVESEVSDALVAVRLDELLAADSDIDGLAPPTVGSVFHELMTKTAASFTYDQTTDSLEAIRDMETTLETAITTVDDLLDTEVAAIKAKTDSLTFSVANQLDANIQSVNDVTVTGTGTSIDPWSP